MTAKDALEIILVPRDNTVEDFPWQSIRFVNTVSIEEEKIMNLEDLASFNALEMYNTLLRRYYDIYRNYKGKIAIVTPENALDPTVPNPFMDLWYYGIYDRVGYGGMGVAISSRPEGRFNVSFAIFFKFTYNF